MLRVRRKDGLTIADGFNLFRRDVTNPLRRVEDHCLHGVGTEFHGVFPEFPGVLPDHDLGVVVDFEGLVLLVGVEFPWTDIDGAVEDLHHAVSELLGKQQLEEGIGVLESLRPPEGRSVGAFADQRQAVGIGKPGVPMMLRRAAQLSGQFLRVRIPDVVEPDCPEGAPLVPCLGDESFAGVFLPQPFREFLIGVRFPVDVPDVRVGIQGADQ